MHAFKKCSSEINFSCVYINAVCCLKVLRLDGVSTDDDDPLLRLEEEICMETRKEEADRKEGCNINGWLQGVLFYYIALPVIKARVVIAGELYFHRGHKFVCQN